MLRLKVQTIRNLLWLGNLLVFVGVALLMAKMWAAKEAGALKHLPVDRIEKEMNSDGTIKNEVLEGVKGYPYYAACVNLNITGVEPVNATEVEHDEVIELPPLQPIDEILIITQLVVAGSWSTASVKYLEDGDGGLPAPGNSRNLAAVLAGGDDTTSSSVRRREPARTLPSRLHLGDTLRSPYDAAPFMGKVIAITSNGVKFNWGEEEVLLGPAHFERSPEVPQKLPGLNDDPEEDSLSVERRELLRKSHQAGENSWFIGFDELDQIENGYEQMLDEISVTAAFSEKEGRSQLMIKQIPEGSLAEQRGFEGEDLIIAVNNQAVSSKYAVMQFFKQNRRLDTYRIEIERRGRRITKVFQIAR